MIIDNLIITDATYEALSLTLAECDSPYILAPNTKTAKWLQRHFSDNNILTYNEVLGENTKAATARQMMLFTIIAIQEKSPLLLEQAPRLNNIINCFYCENAQTWPNISHSASNYPFHYRQIIDAHTQLMLRMQLIPEAVAQLGAINTLGESNLKLNTLVWVQPHSISIVSKTLLEKLKQAAKKQKHYQHSNHPATIIPLHILPTTLDELFHINKLSEQHANSITVSVDAKFQQLCESYRPKENATMKILYDICAYVTSPNKQLEIFQHPLDEGVIAAMENLLSILQEKRPFTETIMAHLSLCKRMGGDIEHALYELDGIEISTHVDDYVMAARALFGATNSTEECFSLAEACETPAEFFIIQGTNQKNWPSNATMELIQTLEQRGSVIFTRSLGDRGSFHEEASFLNDFPIEKIKIVKESINPYPCMRPNPAPPMAARPHDFSITAIELLIRDPYAYYARHILGLRQKEKEHSLARDFGIVIHRIIAHLQLFKLPNTFPEFQIISSRVYEHEVAQLEAPIEVQKIILRRMENLTPYIYELLNQWQKDSVETLVEVKGCREISLSNGTVAKLKSRCDRVDQLSNGGIRITDYKTGTSPTQSEVNKGLFPQLPLEGIINSNDTASLFYVEISGKVDKFAKKQIEYNTEVVLSSVTRLIEMFLINESDGYFAAIKSDIKTADYQHLSRAEEWKY